MEINYRQLVSILNIDAPIHFTPRDQLDKTNYVSCRFMGDDERDAILTGTHLPDGYYDSSDIGLYFPDIDVEEHYNLE